jgi:hypothetical protein
MTLVAVILVMMVGALAVKEMSPLYQHLPTCGNGFNRVQKKTQSKALLCPMIKDEQGFLSEWVAYYTMHGFDHIMFFDDGSTDNGLAELKPWMDAGVVSVRNNWTMANNGFKAHPGAQPYMVAMVTKMLMERDCKRWGIENGYHYFLSADLDEYVIPVTPGVTIVDAFEKFAAKTNRVIFLLTKLNFPSTPHLLEPVDMLTIEAYQQRQKVPGRMNYYTTVGRKIILMLQPPPRWAGNVDKLALMGWSKPNDTATGLTSKTPQYMADCCNFHGCSGKTPGPLIAEFGRNWCNKLHAAPWEIDGKGKKWQSVLVMNHYSRSLEKYELKAKTWKTASGDIKEGGHDQSANYDLANFFHRSVGWYLDRSALRYSCQVREVLNNVTGEAHYLRPGDMWYRNPEFGRPLEDPRKRGRYGRAMAGGRYDDGNVFHYHGKGQKGGADGTMPDA